MVKLKQFYAGGVGKGSAAAYFTDHVSSSDYYLSGCGLLQGTTFDHIGMSSRECDLKVFTALEANNHPETGQQLTPRTHKTRAKWGLNRVTGERVLKHVANRKSGMDLTLVVPKTLSMLIAEHPDEFGREIERVCVRAKDTAMRFAESLAQVSIDGRGAFNERTTGNLLFLSVIHREARATAGGTPDPYWHSHNYCFSQTYDPESKRLMAVTMNHVVKFSECIDALFTAEVVKGLTEMGIGTSRTADNKSFEVTSVVGREIFCKRTAEITAQYRRESALVDTITRFKIKEAGARGEFLDFEKTRNRVRNARSREFAKKKVPIERDEQLAEWRAQMTPTIRKSLSQEDVLAGERRNWLTLEEAKTQVVYSAFKEESVCHEYDIVRDLLRSTGGEISFNDALAFARSDAFIHLDGDRGHVTTDRVRQEERDLLAHARAGWDTCKPLISSPTRPIKDERVKTSRDQSAAVRFLWDSRDSVMDVSGIAGSGKTTLLKEAVAAIREENHVVLLLAPTSASEKNLHEAGFQEAITLQKFLADQEVMPGAADGCTIIVDESSLISVPQMALLVGLTRSHGCRIILTGDSSQHTSVDRGDALRILQGSKSVRSSELTTTYRAKPVYLKEAVMAMKRGGVGCEIGFNLLDEAGDIRELEDVDKMREAAVQTHLESTRRGDLSIMAAPTHVECQLAAEQVRAILKAEGKIEAQDHKVLRLINLNIEGPQLLDPVHYQPDRVILFRYTVKGGFKCGEKWKILGPGEDGAVKVELNGVTKSFNPKASTSLNAKGAWRLYDPLEMVLSVGDQVRITTGFRYQLAKRTSTNMRFDIKFKNNEIARIASIDEERITLDDGRSMPRDYVHLDQGVCITSYASQCRTVTQMVALTPCASLNAMDARTFYVLASRATHRSVFFTDCKQALKESACREGDRHAVWDYEKRDVPKPDSLDLQPGKLVAKKLALNISDQVQRLIAAGALRVKQAQQAIGMER